VLPALKNISIAKRKAVIAKKGGGISKAYVTGGRPRHLEVVLKPSTVLPIISTIELDPLFNPLL
jgi:hypothetical protein